MQYCASNDDTADDWDSGASTNLTDQDFEGMLIYDYAYISGLIVDTNDNPLEGVLVEFSNSFQSTMSH